MKPAFFRIALTALLAAQAAFVTAYVLCERAVYFWDHAMYHALARNLHAAFRSSFSGGAGAFAASLANDYNLIFALPSLAGFAMFGDSRLVFVLANFFVFFIACETAVALLLRRLFALAWRPAFLLGFGACSLIPSLWIPLLEGYPDAGAAACIVFAFYVALDRQKTWRSFFVIGLLAGLAVLLRRHFAYPALALLFTSGLFDLGRVFLSKDRMRRKNLSRLALFYGLCGLTAAAIIGLVAPAFFLRMISVDYSSLYVSYKKPGWDFLVFALSNIGLLPLALALAGFGLAARAFPGAREGLAFVAAAVFVWLAAWCLGPAQAGHHYILHVIPLFLAVGLSGLALALSRRVYVRAALVAVLAANSVWALWLSPEGMLSDADKKMRFYSAPRPPVARPDYDSLLALAGYLEETTTPADRLLVMGSSFVFNQDLLRAVYTDILKHPDFLNRFLWASEIDGVQDPPYDSFASATVYAVPDPPQYHLAKEGQKVVTSIAQQFPPPPFSAALFKEDARAFALANGVTLRVWRRKPWTPGALHKATGLIRETAGGRRDWIALSIPAFVSIATNVQNTTNVFARLDALRSGLSLFFDRSLSGGNYRLAFDILAEPSCKNPRFTLEARTASGQSLWTTAFEPPAVPGSLYRPFAVSGIKDEEAFLFLSYTADFTASCQSLLQFLRVERL